MAKKRVSLTLEEDLVEKIDREASNRSVNRSRTIEEIISQYFRERAVETAVVLCGDRETRSLEEYGGKPVLEHILDHLESEGVSRAILLVGRNDEIRQMFGSSYGELALDYVEEEPRGTAAALRNVDEMIDSIFVVLNGHVLTDVDIREMAQRHHENDSLATMALTTVEDPSSYGVARLKGNTILGFEEKPEPGEEPSRLINAGTYILDPGIFEQLDKDSLEKVFEQLAARGELSGYIYGGDWMDIEEG